MCYQPSGALRGEPFQSLPELALGYYSCTPTTDLQAGDEVVAFSADFLYWEYDKVLFYNYGEVYWEGDIVTYEEVFVYSSDAADLAGENLYDVGSVVGANEFTIPAEDYATIFTNIGDLIIGQQTVTSNYDQTDLTQSGQLRQLNVGEIGFVKEEMKEV